LFPGQLGLISVSSWIHVAQSLIYGVVFFDFFILFISLFIFIFFASRFSFHR